MCKRLFLRAPKIVFGLLIMTALAGTLGAEEGKHWVSGEVGLVGIGARYEYILTPNWSVGANVYWSSFFFVWNEMEVGASARYYPWEKGFFAGVGLGFHMHTGTVDYEYEGYGGTKYTGTWWGTTTGVAISPEVGWKIDVGEPGSFFVQPGIKFPITLGVQEAYNSYATSKFGVGFGVVPYCGLGWVF